MAELLVEVFRKEFTDLVRYLIEHSLVDDQNMPARRARGNSIVTLQSDYWSDSPRIQRKVPYTTLYDDLVAARAYDLRFLDGALVQVQYEFDSRGSQLRRARAAFLPSPDLTPYQEDQELYLHDEIYGDVVDPRVVPVPLRFDFDSRANVVTDLLHPYSHMTIGQYPHCRVALSSALTPYFFLELILRSFYRTNTKLHTDDLPAPRVRMPRTITTREESYAHLRIPS
jgi:hypothetical protein